MKGGFTILFNLRMMCIYTICPFFKKKKKIEYMIVHIFIYLDNFKDVQIFEILNIHRH